MAMKIYIGSKIGSADKIRRQVDTRIPRSAGQVTFFRDGLTVEVVNTTNMREIIYERVCGWLPVHRFADLGYADQVEIQTDAGATQERPQNETYNPY